MYNTVKNSVELQYAIELGAQRLMQVHPRPPTVSVAECLRALREKANSWRSFNLRVTKTLQIHFHEASIVWSKSITHQQLSLFTPYTGKDMSKAIDLNTCTSEMASAPARSWTNDYRNTVPGTSIFSNYIDETQDLLITVNLLSDYNHTSDSMFQINHCTISTGEEHPLAYGSCLVTGSNDLDNNDHERSRDVEVAVLGDRLAFYDVLIIYQEWTTSYYWHYMYGVGIKVDHLP